jgi:exosome complex RNA-binding protein Rrp4
VRCLHLGEHCYNTTFHMSIDVTPFRALYGYDAPTLIDFVFGDSRAPKAKDWIVESQEILKVLKENLQTAQNRQKVSVDRHRIERSFEVGDLVFLRLQPYRQTQVLWALQNHTQGRRSFLRVRASRGESDSQCVPRFLSQET